MKVIAGTVIGGKVEIPAEAFAEGEHVMVLAREAEAEIRLSEEEEEEELLEAMEEIQRGDYVDGEDLLQELRTRTGG